MHPAFVLYNPAHVYRDFFSASVIAQQVVNGGFEQDPASSTTYNPGTGWMITNPPGEPYIYSNSFGHGTTPYGNQWLLLSGGTEAQTIPGPFTIGRRYELFIGAADVEGGTLPYLYVSVSGGTTASQMFAIPQGGSYYTNSPIAFGVYELDFTPTATSPITLSMFGQYPIAFDDVFLVPEPSTWALLSLNAVGTGVVALRRRRTSV